MAEQKIVNLKMLRYPDHDILMRHERGRVGFGGSLEYRNLLENIGIGDCVEANDTFQHGDVTKILRDRWGIPVAVEVEFEEISRDEDTIYRGKDRIAMPNITFWESKEGWASAESYVDEEYEFEWDEEALIEKGYVWDEEEFAYVNHETGDVIV